MSYRVAINGYGRIGQCVLRAIYESGLENLFQVVAINELSDLETVTYLTRYDTTHGRFPVPVGHNGKQLLVNGDTIQILSESDAEDLPWAELGIDLVLECSGSLKTVTAELHLQQWCASVCCFLSLRSPMKWMPLSWFTVSTSNCYAQSIPLVQQPLVPPTVLCRSWICWISTWASKAVSPPLFTPR